MDKRLTKFLQYGISTTLADSLASKDLTISKCRSLSKKDLISTYNIATNDVDFIKSALTRESIPEDVLFSLLKNSNYCCNACKGTKSSAYIVHHIEEHEYTQDNSYNNLILLCPDDHDLAHREGKFLSQKISKKQLFDLKADWEEKVKAHNTEVAFKSKTEELSFPEKIYGSQKQDIINKLNTNWIHSGSPVAILQGLSGVGKSLVVEKLQTDELTIIEPVDVDRGTDEITERVMQMIAGNLEEEGITTLYDAEIKNPLTYFEILGRIIKREKVLIIINDFQRLLSLANPEMTKHWQNLVKYINNARTSHGRILLVSNKIIDNDIWAEKCNFFTLGGLTEDEGKEFLSDYLKSQDLLDCVPEDKLIEVTKVLDGNPRALQIFSSGLNFDSFEGLIKLSPDLFDSKTHSSPELIQRFEQNIIERSLENVDQNLLDFLMYSSVHKHSFKKEALADFEFTQLSLTSYIREMIFRFLISKERNNRYRVHPIAKEVCLNKLYSMHTQWKDAHSLASNYYKNELKLSKLSTAKGITSCYYALRFHLCEADRLNEITDVDEKITTFVLRQISNTPKQTKIPESTEVLEEHIILISAIQDNKRPKGLEYHLALCLKHRNIGDDYVNALSHARKAVSPYSYYAFWLLLIELEYEVNGVKALWETTDKALSFIKGENNAFAIYDFTAKLLRSSNERDKAIELLKQGIASSDVGCLTPLITLCASYLEEIGNVPEAISLIEKHINKKLQGLESLYLKCAKLKVETNDIEGAILLIEEAVQRKDIKKPNKLFLLLGDLYNQVGEFDNTCEVFDEATKDKRIKDPIELYIYWAKLYFQNNEKVKGLELIKKVFKDFKTTPKLQITFAKLLENVGESVEAIRILNDAIKHSNNAYLFEACAEIHFHLTDLDSAISVLKSGIAIKDIKEEHLLVKKCAYFLGRKEEYKQAFDLLQNALDNPRMTNRAFLYQEFSKLLVKAGRIEDAIQKLSEGISAPAVNNKQILIQAKANLLAQNGNLEGAISFLEEVLSQPGLTSLQTLIELYAKLLAESGKRIEAIKYLKGVIKHSDIGLLTQVYYKCAVLLIEENLTDEAIKILTEAILRYPKQNRMLVELRDSLTEKCI